MNYAQALRDLDSRQPESMPGPSLERMEQLVRLLDDPQVTYPSIHITGTNGKTTTARLVTALACAHGLTAGTFISPHLRAVTERLSVCGTDVTEEEFAEEYSRLAPYLDSVDGIGQRVTYFEALTALAYLWFADAPVGLGVFEVGMGGTWDATNLIRGDVAVLGLIGLDHTQILGTTVAEIAGEKAGIIKAGQMAIVRSQRPEAMAVIRSRAEQIDAKLMVEGEAFEVLHRSPAVGGQTLTVRGLHAEYESFFLPLFGDQAARNAAASMAAVEALLGRALDEDAVRQALEGSTVPGRMEVVGRHPLVVLDGGHNPDAMTAVVSALRESFRWGRLIAVVAMFDDKDVEATMRVLAPAVDGAHVAATGSVRAARPERVAAALREAGVTDIGEHASVADAVAAARAAAGPEDAILVTGSFYTVGDVRPLFR